MYGIKNIVTRFIVSEDGPTTVEYALLLALIGIGVIISATNLGETLKAIYGNINERVAATVK